MPLLANKALAAWTAVAMPHDKACLPLTWDMFRDTMMSAFAHPDRQQRARELLHKITQSSTQSVTDYVRYFNSLVQRAGDPVPSMTDQIMFFHTGLLPYMKGKTATNPATGKFWTDLHALQEYAMTIHTHGSSKTATMVPASSLAFSSSKPTHLPSKRVAFAQAANKKPKHNPPKPGKRADGAGPSGVHHQRTSSDRAPAGSAEEMRRIMAATQKKQQAELAARLRKEGK
uniref:Retrotransposon gag domain-containing protein n=1 Tax=Dunaliella tertiolecta TaxID=3047 RepID=A0A6S8IX55_DUNTE|eukprot:1161814-Pelagomonas_calceolata.AAC.12